jgi:hypothetical protein
VKVEVVRSLVERPEAPGELGESRLRIPADAIIPMEKLTSYPMEKLTSYLLVHREWDDKSKFLAQAGFTRENPHLLLTSIRACDVGRSRGR